MVTIHNSTSGTMTIEVHNDNGTSYETTIPANGSFGIPAGANAVNVISVCC